MQARQVGPALLEFPSDMVVTITRDFAAPVELVFDAFTTAEHTRITCAPFGETVTECEFDLRVGGDYRYTFVEDGGEPCTFFGTFQEVDAPTKSVQTWNFSGWPGEHMLESIELSPNEGGTTMTYTLTFFEEKTRSRMTTFEGHLANFNNLDVHLADWQAKHL